MKAYYFGCWNQAGHSLHAPGGRHPGDDRCTYYGDHMHIEGSLAPRRSRDGALCWEGQGRTWDERIRIKWNSGEYPQGQFLRHDLDSGYTAIQWWDRTQGDTRGACNSTLLAEGKHDSATMLALLGEHFPHVLANLARAGIALVDVTPGGPS